jgi:hypothetical protein
MVKLSAPLIRRAALAPLMVLAYGTVLLGLAWVTAVETVFSARRLFGAAPKARAAAADQTNDRPIQTL